MRKGLAIIGRHLSQFLNSVVLQGIEKYTKVSGGYTTISNVRNPLDTRPKDMMESFFLGETLKYLYLLFADRHEIDLSQWVFNTEGHLLPLYPN